VDDAMPKLSFDGDIIVVDQRAMSGDPDAIERVAPDESGRYEVGWGWGWQLVDPARVTASSVTSHRCSRNRAPDSSPSVPGGRGLLRARR
jgi:hypothetical protein